MKSIRILSLVWIIMMCMFPSPTQARANTEYFVTPNGIGDECSRAKPCSADAALAKAETSPEKIYIYFAPGIYTADPPNPAVLDIDLQLHGQDLYLKGSCTWESSGWPDCGMHNERTIIDGNFERIALEVTGIRDAEGENGTKIHIWFFQFYKGNGTGHQLEQCLSYYHGTMAGCGGGVRIINHDQAYILHSELDYNYASWNAPENEISLGGGLYVQNTGELWVDQGLFRYNVASIQGIGLGGGAYIYNVRKIRVKDSLFEQNETSYMTEDGSGAGLVVDMSSFSIQIYKNLFIENNASTNPPTQHPIDGGAIHLVNNVGYEALWGNNFSGNAGISTLAADLSNALGKTEIFGNLFKNSNASFEISVSGKDVEIYNNIIAPTAPTRATSRDAETTGIYLVGVPAEPWSIANVQFNTLVDSDRAVYIGAGVDVLIKNNIIANQTEVGISVSAENNLEPTVENNLFFNNNENGIEGVNAYEGDPLFLDPANGEYHIQAESPAIGKADYDLQIQYDFDRDPRQAFEDDLFADLGADEFRGYYLPLLRK